MIRCIVEFTREIRVADEILDDMKGVSIPNLVFAIHPGWS